MQIGVVAKKIGLSVDAIRFYERNSLLPRVPRTQGGFRQYGESDIDTLRFVRRVQGLGFTIFRSWSMNWAWLYAVATKSCASTLLIAQF